MPGPESLSRSEWVLVVLLVLLCALAFWSQGCASFRQECRYEDQVLVEQVTRSTVVGTGETELATTACAALSYSTRDTGISDNATELGGEIAEGAVRGIVGGGIPSPTRVLGP